MTFSPETMSTRPIEMALAKQAEYLKKGDMNGYWRMFRMIMALDGGAPETTFKQDCFNYETQKTKNKSICLNSY